MERKDPIPKGWYWIDVLTKHQRDTFGDWLKANNRSPTDVKVQVRKTDGDWKLFEVKQPVPRWPVEAKLGFPTVAPYGIQTVKADTSNMPEPELEPLDKLSEFTEDVSPGKLAAYGFLGVAGVAVAGLALVTVVIGGVIWGIKKIVT